MLSTGEIYNLRIWAILFTGFFYVIGVALLFTKCHSPDVDSCSGVSPANIFQGLVQNNVCCNYFTTSDSITICMKEGCYQPQIVLQILPFAEPLRSCLYILTPGVATFQEANATLAKFQNQTYYVTEDNSPICSLPVSEDYNRKVGFVLIIVITSIWGLAFCVSLQCCYRRQPIMLDVPLTRFDTQ